MAVVEVGGVQYYIHDGLKKKWDKIKDGALAQADEDRAYVADGRERTGKSVFVLQQAAYTDPSILNDEDDGKVLPPIPFDDSKDVSEIMTTDKVWLAEATRRYKEGTLLPRITFTAKATLRAIRTTKSDKTKTKVIEFDEAFRGMSSKGALSKENKHLTAALMEMGQNNLVLWITSPSFYLLELYPAVLRTNALFHIKKDKKSKRRVFQVFNYNKKAKLYQIGVRKGWGYPMNTKQKGNFFNKYPGGKDFELRYRLKKQLALQEIDRDEKATSKWKMQRNTAIKVLALDMNLTQEQVSEHMKARGAPISKAQIGYILRDDTENTE